MSLFVILSVLIGYFSLLLILSFLTSRNSDEESFFTGNRKSPWLIVSIGMIGTAISGVTFISLPGTVKTGNFYLAQFILGNVVGYVLIAFILIPLYYRLKLVSIYGYLLKRFGYYSNKTGSAVFIISQSFGAALRMLLAIKVLQVLFFDHFHIPLVITAFIMLILIWGYTKNAGIKTIVWTDVLQTGALLLAVIGTSAVIMSKLDLSMIDMFQLFKTHPNSKLINLDWKSPYNFWKQFISGILIALAMTGIDQNMMQKSLTCHSVRAAQKNVLTFSLSTGLVQLLFLFLGFGLYLFIDKMGVQLPESLYYNGTLHTDGIFPYLANNYFGLFSGICFLIGVIATAFSSADSSLTALTTSFCYDFMNISKCSQIKRNRIKFLTHVGFSLILLGIIISFSQTQGNIFSIIFNVAGYTYGPLLGLFLLGISTKLKINDTIVPWVTISSPIITFFVQRILINQYGFDVGFLVILLNSLLFIILLLTLSKGLKIICKASGQQPL